MKTAGIISALLIPSSLALATPRASSLETITDQLLFSDSLPTFTAARNANNPSTVIWTSDGCTDSPNNPLGFDYLPACQRHDFGYANYRAQSRFTDLAKDYIDNNFHDDMYYQCDSEGVLKYLCQALADVYYEAVEIAGGSDASESPGRKRAEQKERATKYEKAKARYNALALKSGYPDATI